MTSFFQSLVAGLSAREKRLAAAMGVVLVVMLVSLAVFFVRSSISELKRENRARAETTRLLEVRGPEYRIRKMQGRRREFGKPIPLRTMVDQVCKKTGLPDPDTKERPDQPHEGGWIEHAVELSMRRVGLEQLTEFMENVESNRRRFPVAITKLEIRKRRRSEDSFDITMTISTYERFETEEAAEGEGGRNGEAERGGR
ncbi:MAG: hypothetical protein R6V85_00105 [Polyangia bacterium]